MRRSVAVHLVHARAVHALAHGADHGAHAHETTNEQQQQNHQGDDHAVAVRVGRRYQVLGRSAKRRAVWISVVSGKCRQSCEGQSGEDFWKLSIFEDL